MVNGFVGLLSGQKLLVLVLETYALFESISGRAVDVYAPVFQQNVKVLRSKSPIL